MSCQLKHDPQSDDSSSESGDPDPYLSSGTTALEFFGGDKVKFVRYLYDEYKQDVPLPCIAAHYTDDVEWIYGGARKNPDIPIVGRFTGKKGIIEFLTLKERLLDVNKWERAQFIPEEGGNNVVVRVNCEYTIKHSGIKYAVEEIHIHTVSPEFRDAKVHILFDYTPVLEAWNKSK